MLERVLEPEVMDCDQEARDYDAMDHSYVNRVFVADFLAHHPGNGRVLDVGTGSAQIPIELCRQHPTVMVVAVDASPAMIALSETNIARAGLIERIAYQLVDGKRLPYGNAVFQAVMSNSLIHHIPEPRIVLAEMVRVAASGGTIFVRDLLRPASHTAVDALVAQYAADCNAHQKRLFADSLRAALSLNEIGSIITDLGFERESIRQTTDRHWTWIAKRAHGSRL